MQPEAIPTTPFDLSLLRKPTESEFQVLQWKQEDKVVSETVAFCDLSVDLEGSGGAAQALNGTCAIGMAAYARSGRKLLFAREWAVEALAGRDDPKQMDWWNSSETNQAAWARIAASRRPRREVAAELRNLVEKLQALGWRVHLLMRPAAYDFRELTAFFQTLGVQVLAESQRFLEGAMSSKEILDQACCAYDLSKPAPPHYDRRNNMESPFGFGGASQVTDIGQQCAAMARALGSYEFDFRVLLSNVVGRQLIHSGKQDAIDQAQAWYAACDAAQRLQSATQALVDVMRTAPLQDLPAVFAEFAGAKESWNLLITPQ